MTLRRPLLLTLSLSLMGALGCSNDGAGPQVCDPGGLEIEGSCTQVTSYDCTKAGARLVDGACKKCEKAGSACNDKKDNDCNGLIDSEDTACECVPDWQECTQQSKCDVAGCTPSASDPNRCHQDMLQTMWFLVCLDGFCRPPGPFFCGDPKALPKIEVPMTVSVPSAASMGGNGPQSILRRVVLPTLTDGTPLTCASVKDLIGTKDGEATKFDDNPKVNQIARSLLRPDWTTGTSFTRTIDIPEATGVLLIAEAWMGPHSLEQGKDEVPTKARYGFGCVENVNIKMGMAPPPTVRVDPDL